MDTYRLVEESRATARCSRSFTPSARGPLLRRRTSPATTRPARSSRSVLRPARGSTSRRVGLRGERVRTARPAPLPVLVEGTFQARPFHLGRQEPEEPDRSRAGARWCGRGVFGGAHRARDHRGSPHPVSCAGTIVHVELSLHPGHRIVGPTASGKTDAAQDRRRAPRRGSGERRFHADLPGHGHRHGQVPASERRVPHHGFDLVDPGEPYSAALFQAFARHCIRDVDARGKRAVLCGGTGEYVPGGHSTTSLSPRATRWKTPSANAGPPMRRNTATRPCGRRWRRAIPQAPPSSTPTTCGASCVPSSCCEEGASVRRAETAARHRGALRSQRRAIRAGRGAGYPGNERIDARVDAMVGRRARRRGAGPAGRRIPRRRHGAPGHRIQGDRRGAGWETSR